MPNNHLKLATIYFHRRLLSGASVITEITNGCQLVILSRINTQISFILSTALVHNPAMFHESRVGSFRCLRKNKRTDTGENITSLAKGIIRPKHVSWHLVKRI